MQEWVACQCLGQVVVPDAWKLRHSFDGCVSECSAPDSPVFCGLFSSSECYDKTSVYQRGSRSDGGGQVAPRETERHERRMEVKKAKANLDGRIERRATIDRPEAGTQGTGHSLRRWSTNGPLGRLTGIGADGERRDHGRCQCAALRTGHTGVLLTKGGSDLIVSS